VSQGGESDDRVKSLDPSVTGPDAISDQLASIDIETPSRRGDVIAALLCLGAGLAGYFFVVPSAVYVPSKFADTVNSPAFLPNVLFLLLTGLSVVYLVQSFVAFRRDAAQGRTPLSDWGLVGGTVLICIGYVGAIYIVGLSLASALAVAATMLYFGERRVWTIASVAVVLPALLLYFFVEIAHILLPTPALEFIESWESVFNPGGMFEMAWRFAPVTG
jgi:hypothetical protein